MSGDVEGERDGSGARFATLRRSTVGGRCLVERVEQGEGVVFGAALR